MNVKKMDGIHSKFEPLMPTTLDAFNKDISFPLAKHDMKPLVTILAVNLVNIQIYSVRNRKRAMLVANEKASFAKHSEIEKHTL